jgi:hypothetical protein
VLLHSARNYRLLRNGSSLFSQQQGARGHERLFGRERSFASSSNRAVRNASFPLTLALYSVRQFPPFRPGPSFLVMLLPWLLLVVVLQVLFLETHRKHPDDWFRRDAACFGCCGLTVELPVPT